MIGLVIVVFVKLSFGCQNMTAGYGAIGIYVSYSVSRCADNVGSTERYDGDKCAIVCFLLHSCFVFLGGLYY